MLPSNGTNSDRSQKHEISQTPTSEGRDYYTIFNNIRINKTTLHY